MSWHFSRALVAAYSAARCSDGGPSALSSSTPTPEPSSPHGKTTAASLLSRSGTTSGPSTDALGEELLAWFREASRARTSASLAEGPASVVPAADCGVRCGASLAKYDHATSSWRTHQRSLLGDWEPCSETWPRWGMMRGGECWELSTPVRRIAGTASGLWLTPTCYSCKTACRSDAELAWNGDSRSNGAKVQIRLQGVVKFWPTPCALEVEKDVENWARKRALPRSEKGGSHGPNLATAVKLFPTPTSQDAKNCTLPPSQRERDSIPGMMLRTGEAPGGQLNPSWVEWLMNWPIGWTDTEKDCHYENEYWKAAGSENLQCDLLREMWFNVEAGAPSRRQESSEQHAGECSDSLFAVPPQGTHPSKSCDVCCVRDAVSTEEVTESDALRVFRMQQDSRPTLSRVEMGVRHRVDRLRAIGNGQVPAVAALAWRLLSVNLQPRNLQP